MGPGSDREEEFVRTDGETRDSELPPTSDDPRVLRSRAALLEAATQHFLEHGYLGTNLDDVARRAGVAKRTIYNVVGDKEALFRAVLAEAVDTAEHYSVQVVANLGTSADVDTELHDAGLRLARAVLGGRVVPLRRLLIAETRRFPELAQDYYRRAPGRVMDALADAFRRYDEQGQLAISDPMRAAEHLAFLILGASLDRALFSPDHIPEDQALIEDRVRSGVEVFLRAHRLQ
jgi:TetR/AcrR family transcriptional regulator, mexJK operon transcriptional repressor